MKTENTVWKLRMIIKISSALIFDPEIFTSKLSKHWFGLHNQIAETGKNFKGLQNKWFKILNYI